MAYAYVKKVYAGTNVITLPFSYLSTNDVYLWVNDVLRPQSEITWTSSSIVTITTAGLTAGDVILIARVTNIASSNVVYSNDTQLTKDNLNNANKQLLYLNQETRDVTTLANATASTSMAAQVAAASASAAAAASDAEDAAESAVAAAGYAESMADLIEAVTPANILTAIKTVDGSGSGLDADLLDGNDSSVFATAANLTSHTGATAVHSATSANTASRIVSRDSSGNFSAGTITANLTGTASAATLAASATKLATARTINVSGGVTGTAQSFDGTANITIPTTITAADALTAIKTVDGAGSGLDADTLDGVELAGIVDYLAGSYQTIIHKGTCATATTTAAKTVTITGYTPAVGDILAITMTNGTSVASMTLNVNSIGAVYVRLGNVNVTTVNCALAAGAVLLLYYDGTYYQMLGSHRITDSDTINQTAMGGVMKVGTYPLYSYKLCVTGADGWLYPVTLETGTDTTKTVLTTSFVPGAFIGIYNSATTVAALGNASANSVYTTLASTNGSYTFNQSSFTAYQPLYLKCVPQSNGLLKLDNTSYTSFYTQSLPTTEDGYVYVLLGYMYSTAGLLLIETNTIYEYRGSGIRLWTGATPASLLADIKTVDGAGSGLDADTLDGVELSGIVDYLSTSYAPLSHVSDTAPHGAVSTNTASRIVTRDASGNFSAGTISANLTGTATSATYAAQLLSSRSIAISGDVTGTATVFNNTANISIPATLTKARAGTHAFRRMGLSAGGDNITITASNGTATCSFNLSSYAIGSGSAAALFTAPITGLYHFDVCLRFYTTTNAATGVACGLQTPTNLFYGTCPIPDGTLTGDLFTCNVSIDEYLTAGGTVSVSALKLGAGSCVVDVGASWWSGHLVYAA